MAGASAGASGFSAASAMTFSRIFSAPFSPLAAFSPFGVFGFRAGFSAPSAFGAFGFRAGFSGFAAFTGSAGFASIFSSAIALTCAASPSCR
ncbi:MAG: hypothetical protein H6R29_181 [Methanomicrobia archaeon]|nr:hypothetical protein [Methanomicrobia archaeon]